MKSIKAPQVLHLHALAVDEVLLLPNFTPLLRNRKVSSIHNESQRVRKQSNAIAPWALGPPAIGTSSVQNASTTSQAACRMTVSTTRLKTRPGVAVLPFQPINTKLI